MLVHFRVHKGLLLVQSTPYCPIFNKSINSSHIYSFPTQFSHQNFTYFSHAICMLHSTQPINSILLHCTILIVFGVQHKLRSYSLCRVLQLCFASPLWSINFPLSTHLPTQWLHNLSSAWHKFHIHSEKR